MRPSEARLSEPDGEEVKSAARRIFDAGLCCAVEAERRDAPGIGAAAWETRLLLFASAAPSRAVGAVEDTLALLPGTRVRVAAYDPARLCRVAPSAALVCSPR